MADCASNPQYLLTAAECSLSDVRAEQASQELFWYAPNPFPEGRARQRQAWLNAWRIHAAKLVWC